MVDVDLALRNLAQPRVDIAAQHLQPHIAAPRQDLRLPAQRRGADAAAGSEIGQTGAGRARHDRVARILARHHAGEREAGRQFGGHVLHRMHGKIDAPVRQRLLEFLDEQALAADRGERPVLDAVARRADDDGLERAGFGEVGPARGQRGAQGIGLGERER